MNGMSVFIIPAKTLPIKSLYDLFYIYLKREGQMKYPIIKLIILP